MYKDIGEAVKAIGKEVEQAAELTLIEAGKFARDTALSTTTFRVSSTFRQATQFHRVDKLNGFVLADKPYAQYLEFGNNEQGPYIYPKRVKALHFKINDNDVFAKKVRSHPGYYFMQDAGTKLEENMENIFLNNLNKTLKEE